MLFQIHSWPEGDTNWWQIFSARRSLQFGYYNNTIAQRFSNDVYKTIHSTVASFILANDDHFASLPNVLLMGNSDMSFDNFAPSLKGTLSDLLCTIDSCNLWFPSKVLFYD